MKKIKTGKVYYFRTKEAYCDFMKTAENQGYRWASGHKPTKWSSYEKDFSKNDRCILTWDFDNDKVITCDSLWGWDDAILWEVENEPPTIVEHLIRGNKTIVKLSNGKVGVARCHPDDKFDIYEGLRVATARAYGKPVEEPKEEPKKDVLKVKCVQARGFGAFRFTEGKVYERVNGVLIDDTGDEWNRSCKDSDPTIWKIYSTKFELYEEPEETAPAIVGVPINWDCGNTLDENVYNLTVIVRRLCCATNAVIDRVNSFKGGTNE